MIWLGEYQLTIIGRNEKSLYLINFNIPFPEVIQKIEITDSKVPELQLYHLSEIKFEHIDNDNDIIQDNGYIFIKKNQTSYENGKFYNLEYIVQYIHINTKRIERDF